MMIYCGGGGVGKAKYLSVNKQFFFFKMYRREYPTIISQNLVVSQVLRSCSISPKRDENFTDSIYDRYLASDVFKPHNPLVNNLNEEREQLFKSIKMEEIPQQQTQTQQTQQQTAHFNRMDQQRYNQNYRALNQIQQQGFYHHRGDVIHQPQRQQVNHNYERELRQFDRERRQFYRERNANYREGEANHRQHRNVSQQNATQQLRSREIVQLTEIQFQSNRASQWDEQDKKCSICLSEFVNGDRLRFLPCLHRFHSSCVDVWLKKNCKCPLCKKNVKELLEEMKK